MKDYNNHLGPSRPIHYQIRVQGELDASWSDWFDGLAITTEGACGEHVISAINGTIDQAALRGILTKLWDLNLTLISVNQTGRYQIESF